MAPHTTDHPGFETFNLDTANGVFDYAQVSGAGANRVSTTSVELNDSALNTNDFVMSTRVTIDNSGRVGATGNTAVGFGAFSNTSDFSTGAGSTYYLTDWFVHSNVALAYGRLRIHAQGDASDFTATFGDSDNAGDWNGSSITWGETYELRLTGIYDAGILSLTLAVFDELGNQMGTPATATDASPMAGTYFGYRNALSVGATNLDFAYDNFSVAPPAAEARSVPEPSALLLLVAGAFGLRAGRNRRADGRSGQQALMRRSAVAVALIYCPTFAASAVQGATYPYTNDFSSTGFENATDHPDLETFNLDTANGKFTFAQQAGVAGANRVSTTSVELNDSALTTNNFVVSTHFVLQNSGYVGATGNTAIGFGAFSNTSNFSTAVGSTYYLTDWFIHSNSTAAYGRLRIHAQGDASDFTSAFGDSDGANINGSSIVWGETYELRLTGIYNAGALDLTLALFDALGNQLGTAATATDASPMAGTFFGYRNAVSTAATQTTIDYDDFSVTGAASEESADFDDDGDVDGNDFLVWQRGAGSGGGPSEGDANGDGTVDGDDLAVWKVQFGAATSVNVAAIPEPSCWTLLAVALMHLASRRVFGNGKQTIKG